MARKSKLTLKQWDEVRRRYIAGERISALAREFKVDESTVRQRMKEDRPTEKRVAPGKIKEAAAKSVENDLKDPLIGPLISEMGEKDRGLFYSAKNDLTEIIAQLSFASRYSAQNAHKLARMSQKQLSKMDEDAAPGSKDEAVNDSLHLRALKFQMHSNEAAKQPQKLAEILLKSQNESKADDSVRTIKLINEPDV